MRLELDQLKKLNGTDVDLQAVRAFLLKHKANMQSASDDTKKALVDAFVHRIVIDSDKVTLTLKIDEELDEATINSDTRHTTPYIILTVLNGVRKDKPIRKNKALLIGAFFMSYSFVFCPYSGFFCRLVLLIG